MNFVRYMLMVLILAPIILFAIYLIYDDFRINMLQMRISKDQRKKIIVEALICVDDLKLTRGKDFIKQNKSLFNLVKHNDFKACCHVLELYRDVNVVEI